MRAAVVGYGYWGPNVARSLAELVGPNNVLICERRPERLVQAAQDLPEAEQTTDWATVLGCADIEAIALCTPAATHFGLAMEALAAGKHLLVEKPIVTSTEQAVLLADEAERRGQTLMVGHVFRYLPAFHVLRSLIADGTLGELRYLHSDRTSLGPRAREDVTVVWDYLIHDVYLLPWLVGRPVSSVRAIGGCYLRPDIEDVVFAHWDFGGGVIASSRASWYDPEKVRRLVVVGSSGMAVLDDLKLDGRLTLFRRGYAPAEGTDDFGNQGLRLFDEGGETVSTSDEQPLVAECRAFLAAIQDGEALPQGRDEIVATTAVCETVERSLKTGDQETVSSSAVGVSGINGRREP